MGQTVSFTENRVKQLIFSRYWDFISLSWRIISSLQGLDRGEYKWRNRNFKFSLRKIISWMPEGLNFCLRKVSPPEFYIVSAAIASQAPSPLNHLLVPPALSHYQLVVWSLKSKNENSMKQQQQSQVQIGIFSVPWGSWDFQSSVKTGVIFLFLPCFTPTSNSSSSLHAFSS